jgi:YVTN family beta-propeller protein
VATNTPGTPILVGSHPSWIAITPDGNTAYVTNTDSNTVTPIAVATNTPGIPIVVGHAPVAVAITPNGKTAYVSNANNGSDPYDNAVVPIDLATNTPGNPIHTGTNPVRIAITPDGVTAYVANAVSNTVTPIDVATNTPGTPIPVGSLPLGIAITSTQRPTSTSTRLSVNPPSPAAAGTRETLTGTITPAAATGSVQFIDGTGPIGMIAIPIGSPMTVTNGSASITTPLTPGTHSLTAVFTSADPAAFNSATSNVLPYVVSAPTKTPPPPTPPVIGGFPPQIFQQFIAWLLRQLHLPTF